MYVPRFGRGQEDLIECPQARWTEKGCCSCNTCLQLSEYEFKFFLYLAQTGQVSCRGGKLCLARPPQAAQAAAIVTYMYETHSLFFVVRRGLAGSFGLMHSNAELSRLPRAASRYILPWYVILLERRWEDAFRHKQLLILVCR